MRDIPMFTTEYGVASLLLGQIPYTGCAYVHIRDTGFLSTFLQECADFCGAAGAQRIYAAGHKDLCNYSAYATILKLRVDKEALPQSSASCEPVSAESLQMWRDIYNRKMKNVPLASYMTAEQGKAMLQKGEGYFLYGDSGLLGIGMASENRIHALASLRSGAGSSIVAALSQRMQGPEIWLEVAAENRKACGLYESLGFQQTGEQTVWYEIS